MYAYSNVNKQGDICLWQPGQAVREICVWQSDHAVRDIYVFGYLAIEWEAMYVWLSDHTMRGHVCLWLSGHTVIGHLCLWLSGHTVRGHVCVWLSGHTVRGHACMWLCGHTVRSHVCVLLPSQTERGNIHYWDPGNIHYLISDAARGKYCNIRYSWNIMPVWNYFWFLHICPLQTYFPLLACCYAVAMCEAIIKHIHDVITYPMVSYNGLYDLWLNGAMVYLTIAFFVIIH